MRSGGDLERLGEPGDAVELVGEVGVAVATPSSSTKLPRSLTRSRWMRTFCHSSRWRSFSTTASVPRLASSAAHSARGSSTGISR